MRTRISPYRGRGGAQRRACALAVVQFPGAMRHGLLWREGEEEEEEEEVENAT